MDLLAGYGSDVSSADDKTTDDPGTRQSASDSGRCAVATDETHGASSKSTDYEATGRLPAGFFDAQIARPSVPPASTSIELDEGQQKSSDIFSRLPLPAAKLSSGAKPVKRAKRAVKLRLPINLDASMESDEEDQPKKKLKGISTRGMKLADILPPPKNDFGVGFATGRRLDTEQPTVSDDDQDDPSLDPNGEGLASAVGLSHTNEIYIMDGQEPEEYQYNNYGQAVEQTGVEQEVSEHGVDPYHYNPYYQYGEAQPGTDGQPNSVPTAAPMDPNQFLDAALLAEQEKARKQGKRLDRGGVKILEVNQQQLTYVNPTAKAEMNSLRTAMGEGYEAQLRSQAGPAPNKLAKRKHQISSLYHQAKLKELELLEKRGQSLKTKAETQAKYGWA